MNEKEKKLKKLLCWCEEISKDAYNAVNDKEPLLTTTVLIHDLKLWADEAFKIWMEIKRGE